MQKSQQLMSRALISIFIILSNKFTTTQSTTEQFSFIEIISLITLIFSLINLELNKNRESGWWIFEHLSKDNVYKVFSKTIALMWIAVTVAIIFEESNTTLDLVRLIASSTNILLY